MKKVVLHIDSAGEHREVTLKDEISIGRTDSADIALPDSGLSRVNTTFFREDDEVFVVDENSTNGTFLNGEQISRSPHQIKDRDEITAGNETVIYVEIFAEKPVKTSPEAEKKSTEPKQIKKKVKKSVAQSNQLPMIPIIIVSSVFLLAFLVLGGILIYSLLEPASPGDDKPKPASISTDLLIPMRVIDPLGGEDPDDIDDLVAALNNEVADRTVDDKDLVETQNNIVVTNSSPENKQENDLLMVKPEFVTEKLRLSREVREPAGINPQGLVVLQELCCNVPKQVAKLEEMVKAGYTQPLDYADLADRRIHGKLLELPVATEDYVLDVGGNATKDEFNEFSWDTTPYAKPLTTDNPKYKILQQLAENFGGQKYDLNNPSHRQQMKIRLLRMFHPTARLILMEFAKKYRERFNRPLRITSLTRSMEYQISLNSNNANSFKVRGEGSRPPHTSGCAFDLARKHMSVDEQNFMIQTLAEMERRGVLDALIEGNKNACFHIFIYDDGKKPKGF